MTGATDFTTLRFGVIGASGIHGRRIANHLEPLGEVVWTMNSSETGSERERVDWVFIAAPNLFHYEYALEFLDQGINVFLEKPPTLSSRSYRRLIERALQAGARLYVDDVFLFCPDIDYRVGLRQDETLAWTKTSSKPGSLLDRLCYHHLYMLREVAGSDDDIRDIQVRTKSSEKIDFSFAYAGSSIDLQYEIGAQADENNFLGRRISPGEPNAIGKMLKVVLAANTRDFESNQSRSLWTLRQLETLKDALQHRVAVIGAGLFGCSAALELSAAGYSVDLYERHDDILAEASSINQYRVHRGYHYPRSDETVAECLNAIPLFMKYYGKAIMTKAVSGSYYAISSTLSRISGKDYIDFLKRHQLEYVVTDNLPNTELTVRVREDLFDPQKLKELVTQRLFGSGVNVKCGVEADESTVASYEASLVATYSGQNNFAARHQQYQFELVEKPILQLPLEYRGKSVVILDGPFMCIDPYSDTPYHVMGNVVHAIHHVNTGEAPVIPDDFRAVMNRGVVKPPAISKIGQFLLSASRYFPGIEKATHIGSMFTIRTVLPDRDGDDARPTVVEWLSGKSVGIFAGKICHSVAAAQNALELINARFKSSDTH